MDRLKLLALDQEDLAVVSAHIQDSILKVRDMDFSRREKRFLLAIRRFAWETKEDKERRISVLHFDRVLGVKLSGISQSAHDAVLSLLAVKFEPSAEKSDPSGTIELLFAGDGTVRLDVECIEAQLTDMDTSWKVGSTPDHTAAQETQS